MRKVAIVTGGTRGIGFAIAQQMIKAGFITCIMSRSAEEVCADALNALRATEADVTPEVFYMAGGIGVAADREAFVSEVVRRYGRIDVLVNNAGVAPKVRTDLLSATEESFDYVTGVNLKGTMFMSQLVANQMLAQPLPDEGMRGVIVNISSFSAAVSSPNRPEYCVSKAGISMLTKLFADRLAGEGIYVYEVQPGVIKTDMTAKVQEKYDRLLAGDQFPIHRWGTPEDVANVVKMFVCGNMSYTTGQVIYVDGGFMNIRSI